MPPLDKYYDYSQYEGLKVEKQDKVMTITLNEPEAMNAFSMPMHYSFSRIWEDVQDDPEVNVIVLTGAGRAFSAGGNVIAMQQKIDNPDLWDATSAPEAKRIIFRMLECDKPIIARVNGHAVGLGATVALMCDIIIAADTAKIGDPHVSAGLVAGDGGALMWPQLIGFARAKEYLFTGDLMTATEAHRIGLINHVVSAEELDEKVYTLAKRLAGGAMKSIRWTKQVMNIPLRQIAHSTMDLSIALETQSNLSKDHQEAVSAFKAKRTPNFTGEEQDWHCSPAHTPGSSAQPTNCPAAAALARCRERQAGTTSMNFDFSDDLKQLRDEARRFLTEQCAPAVVRRSLDEQEPFSATLWQAMAEMGWIGAAIPEEFGGAGLGYEGLCVLAEELGRVVAPVPFASTAYLAAEAILLAGTDAQKREWLPRFSDGSAIGCLALSEGNGNPDPAGIRVRVSGGRLTGAKWPVADGNIAQVAVVVARDEANQIALYLVPLDGVTRRELKTLDPSRDQARLDLDNTPAERMPNTDGWASVQRLLDRAAILFAFEQVGGADASLQMARNYALERFAFGRPIGSFQAIKHKLADMYVALELARSNAYYGAWALATDAAELPLAAATVRVSATEAFHLAAKENIQTHGGVGFTWQVDCHLFYRRSKQLALNLGGAPFWKNRLVDLLETRNVA